MEKKKRNSILSTFPKDEDQTTEFGMRLRRRVSFSEKKSIRVFSGEDVPKTWDNSYELSDRNDSNQNSQNKIEGNSNESQVHSSSALCTTTEFINKSNLSEIHVDHSLSLTLCAHELQSIKQNCEKSSTKNDNEIDLNIQLHVPKSVTTNTPGTITENKNTQPEINSRPEDFIYINENSNKENIAPESYAFSDVVSSKKSSVEKTEPAKTDATDTIGDGIHLNTKSSTVVPHQIYTNISSNPEKTLSSHKMDAMDIVENVSGICPIAESPTFSNNESPLDFFSPLIPPGILPKCNKKLDFLQLNEDMANGRLKLFPNIQKASNNSNKIGPIISSKFFATKTPSYCLDITDMNAQNCNFEKKESISNKNLDVEPMPMNISKGAIPKNQSTIKERTTYIQTLVETSTNSNDYLKRRSLKSQTVYYDDYIESEKVTAKDSQAFSERMENTMNKDFLDKSEKIKSIQFEKKTGEVQKNILEVSSMELTESPHNGYGYMKIPVDVSNNTNNKRRTIYLEDEPIEIEVQEPNPVVDYEEIVVNNPHVPVKKLEFLKTFSDPEKIHKPINRYTHHFGNDEKLDLVDSSNTEQGFQNKEAPKVRRDTHYFDRSGIMDMTNNSNEVVGDLQAINKYIDIEEDECVIPETAPMETMIETVNKHQKISTKHFDDNEELNDDHEFLMPESEELEKRIQKTSNESLNNQKRNLTQYFHKSDDVMEESDYEVPESQSTASTLQTSKIPKVTMNNQTYNLSEYFYRNYEIMEESNCNVPVSVLQAKKDSKTSMSNAIQLQTLYYNENEQFDEDHECVIPESEPVGTNVQFPNILKAIMSNQKQRLTQYFNENAEMNISNETKESRDHGVSRVEPLIKTQCFNSNEFINTADESQMKCYIDIKSKSHQSNAVNKCLFAIQCPKLGNEDESIENQGEQYNKDLSKVYETRKTTYFGPDESLNITNLSDKQNLPLSENVVSSQLLQSTANPPGLTANKNDLHECPLKLKDIVSHHSDNRRTHIFNNNDSMNITNTPFHQSASIDIDQNRFPKRYTEHFNSSDAHIHPIQDSTDEILHKQFESKHSSKQIYSETCHFDDEVEMDVTNRSNIEQQEEFIHRPTKTTPSNKKDDQSSPSIKRQPHSSQETKCKRQLESKFSSANKQKTVLFSSTIDEIEIETTPTSPQKTAGYRYDAFSPATPHRSILEFLRMEREVEEEDQNATDNTFTNEKMQKSKESSFSNQKRTTLNLTPNLPESKKQRNDVDLKNSNSILKEKQMKANNIKPENSKLKGTHFMEGVVPLVQSTEAITYEGEIIGDKSEKKIDMEKIIATEDIENLPQEPITPSHKEVRVSRIPIYSGSSKKNKISRRSSENMNSLLNLDFSMNTVEMARFAVNDVENSRYILRDGLTSEFNFSKKDLSRKRSIFVSEDNPITISDVSEHYLSQKQRRTFTPDITSNKIKDKNDQLMESILEIIDGDDIEKTKLDLVETLLEETEQEDHQLSGDLEQFEQLKIDNINQTIQNEKNGQMMTQSSCDLKKPETQITKKHNASLCRKCKRCQDMYLNETATTETNESFAIPPLPSFSTLRKCFFNGMEKMRKGPTLDVAFEFYGRIKIKQSIDIFNMSIDKALEEEEDLYEDPFVVEYKKKLDQLDKDISSQLFKAIPIQKPFVSRLKKLLSGTDTKNWILNDEMQHRQILRLRHKELVTFCIIIRYEKKDSFGVDIVITHISLEDSSVPRRTWTPYDFMTNFQLKIELPFNMRSFCLGNSEFDVYEMLLKIDEICRDVSIISKDLWKIVIEEDCNLIRENDQTLIRKIVRNVINDSDGFYLSTEKTEFRIEISNIKQLSFRDITKPLLYMFREDIQNLPAGLEFLKTFLKNPKSFLKSVTI